MTEANHLAEQIDCIANKSRVRSYAQFSRVPKSRTHPSMVTAIVGLASISPRRNRVKELEFSHVVMHLPENSTEPSQEPSLRGCYAMQEVVRRIEDRMRTVSGRFEDISIRLTKPIGA